MTDDFHLAEKVDPAESLVELYGINDAIEILKDKLDENPADPETRRQAKLLVHLVNEKMAPLIKKISH